MTLQLASELVLQFKTRESIYYLMASNGNVSREAAVYNLSTSCAVVLRLRRDLILGSMFYQSKSMTDTRVQFYNVTSSTIFLSRAVL